MADNTTVHIGENSPEYVAYRLFLDVMSAENKTFHSSSTRQAVDRAYILKTYHECRLVVSGVKPKD